MNCRFLTFELPAINSEDEPQRTDYGQDVNHITNVFAYEQFRWMLQELGVPSCTQVGHTTYQIVHD